MMKIGILSFAHTHAASYVALLNGREGIAVVAADPLPASTSGELRGRELADQLGVEYMETYEEVFAWKPDAVIVCSENVHHRELVEMAAAAGAHVLCEKPIATEIADAEAMIEVCHQAGVKLMVAHPVRFSPMFTSLVSTVEAGALGQIVGVTGTNNGKIPVGKRAWFTDPDLSGGGAIVDHTVHVADLLDALFESRATTVYCASNRILHSDKPEVQVETGGLVSITYENGAVATIDCSWSHPDSAPNWGGLTMQLAGTKGSAEIDPFALHVGGTEDPSGKGFWLGYGPDTDRYMLEEFLDAVQTARQPQPDGAVGLRTLQIVKAAQESARTGLPITISH